MYIYQISKFWYVFKVFGIYIFYLVYIKNLVYTVLGIFFSEGYLRPHTKFILWQGMDREIIVVLELCVKSLMILINMGVWY